MPQDRQSSSSGIRSEMIVNSEEKMEKNLDSDSRDERGGDCKTGGFTPISHCDSTGLCPFIAMPFIRPLSPSPLL